MSATTAASKVPKPVNAINGQDELNGTSILDVTDPRSSRNISRTFPAPEGEAEPGGAQMTRVCDGKSLRKGDPNAVYLLRTFGREAMRSGTLPIRRSRSWFGASAG